jgi:hypothetical protein
MAAAKHIVRKLQMKGAINPVINAAIAEWPAIAIWERWAVERMSLGIFCFR